jgi:hypothetical protein
MNVLEHQMDAVNLALDAITLTAVSRPDTPVLLILHWHGFPSRSSMFRRRGQ